MCFILTSAKREYRPILQHEFVKQWITYICTIMFTAVSIQRIITQNLNLILTLAMWPHIYSTNTMMIRQTICYFTRQSVLFCEKSEVAVNITSHTNTNNDNHMPNRNMQIEQHCYGVFRCRSHLHRKWFVVSIICRLSITVCTKRFYRCLTHWPLGDAILD